MLLLFFIRVLLCRSFSFSKCVRTPHTTLFPKEKHIVLNGIVLTVRTATAVWFVLLSTRPLATVKCLSTRQFRRMLPFNCSHTFVRMLGCLLYIYALVIKQTKGTPKIKQTAKSSMRIKKKRACRNETSKKIRFAIYDDELVGRE